MDESALRESLFKAKPEIVFHLAAQALVRVGYAQPAETMACNIMGTANILDVARQSDSVRAVVVITTDKVYRNREWPHAYREADELGGHDPYSASKAAAEIVAESYRASYFTQGHPARIATARAGNVIGGGDWAPDRLVPDCLRAFAQHVPVQLRYPGAVRPWQHVLEPLAGYLQLGARLLSQDGDTFARSWNFGPDIHGDASVGSIAQSIAGLWGDAVEVRSAPSADNPHEAGLLRLDSTLARTLLGWQPRWSLEQTLAQTVAWYKAWLRGEDMSRITRAQIEMYDAEASL